MKLLKTPLYLQILAAIVLAIITGTCVQAFASESVLSGASSTFDFIGSLFIQALKMLIVPLIVSAVISSMAAIGAETGFGRLASKTLAYYLVTSTIAILIGLALVNLFQPGMIDGKPGYEAFELPEPDNETLAKAAGKDGSDVVNIFKRMLPPNVIIAAADGQILGLIVFSIIFGFFITRIAGDLRETMEKFWQAVYEVMLKITELIMAFSPIGVFALIASICIKTDITEVVKLVWFPITVVLALGVHLFITMPLLLKLIARVQPVKHFRAMVSALLTAFSTASSAATLPLTMECLTDNAGVSKRVTSFTTPLGATVNMDGTALYECVAVIFLMQFFGLEISFGAQFTVVALALLTSIGVAGIPSASLVAILIILNAVGMPEEFIGIGVALLQFTDRILDMCRTAVNVFGDSCGAVLIARSEGEETSLK
ncbi:MAG: dicarboxylate/amino acid:cation symporter [Gammaproteobacteria bacterium]|nr:dicarboxylate/amino acid:cation symporter [Gammaproteobacteria bacterium]